MKFGILAPTLNEINILFDHFPAEAIQFKDYFPNERNKSFSAILHLYKPYTLKEMKGIASQLKNCRLFVYAMGRRDKNAEHKTTIEKVPKGDSFCVLKKNGTVRELKVYIREDYDKSRKRYEGQSCDDTSQYRYFEKGQLVIVNPSH